MRFIGDKYGGQFCVYTVSVVGGFRSNGGQAALAVILTCCRVAHGFDLIAMVRSSFVSNGQRG